MQDEISERIQREFPNDPVTVQLDGNRVAIKVVSSEFEDVPRVRRQQRIYGCLNDLIQSGAIHAVTITAQTEAENQGT